jgi:hypothetical protein
MMKAAAILEGKDPNMARDSAITNVDIAVYALAILRGANRRVKSEDIAAKCYALCPARFSWRLIIYRDKGWPDKYIVKTALEDAKKEKNGGLVDGSYSLDLSKDGWQLTPPGAVWFRTNTKRIEKVLKPDTTGTVLSKSSAKQEYAPRGSKTFSSSEIVTVAVFLLGGESHQVDTEDVAVKANELAPGRFLWRKYPSQINIENVRALLSSAKSLQNGYLIGTGKEGWLLTEKGLLFARRQIDNLKGVDLSASRLSPRERHWLRNERTRLLASKALRKYEALGIEAVSAREAEAFFGVDDYITGDTRERNVLRIVNLFGDDAQLGRPVKDLATKVRRG